VDENSLKPDLFHEHLIRMSRSASLTVPFELLARKEPKDKHDGSDNQINA
jgi:hypothetical protein